MVFDTVLTYGHESWVMTERMLSQVQAAEMGSLKKVESVTLRDKVQSCEVSKNPPCHYLSNREIPGALVRSCI